MTQAQMVKGLIPNPQTYDQLKAVETIAKLAGADIIHWSDRVCFEFTDLSILRTDAFGYMED